MQQQLHTTGENVRYCFLSVCIIDLQVPFQGPSTDGMLDQHYCRVLVVQRNALMLRKEKWACWEET